MYRIVSVTMMIVMTCTARVKTTERPSDVPTHTHTHTLHCAYPPTLLHSVAGHEWNGCHITDGE